MKYYNTKDVYFGHLKFDAGKDGFYHSAVEVFIKSDESYVKLNSKYKQRYKEFSNNNDFYVTVSDLFPLVNMIPKEKLTDTISTGRIKLYLLKYKLTKKDKTIGISKPKTR